jgi:hypothetical protein
LLSGCSELLLAYTFYCQKQKEKNFLRNFHNIIGRFSVDFRSLQVKYNFVLLGFRRVQTFFQQFGVQWIGHLHGEKQIAMFAASKRLQPTTLFSSKSRHYKMFKEQSLGENK